MSGETEQNVSGWTTDTLKEYLEARITANKEISEQHISSVKESVEKAFKASEKAIDKADTATEKRFDNTNEFRGQLQDQERTFIPRNEFDSVIRAMQDKIDAQKERLDKSEGQDKGKSDNTAWIFAAIATLAAVVVIVVAIINVVTGN